MKRVNEIEQEIELTYSKLLSPYATQNSTAHRRISEAAIRFRPPFALDRDRIIYSGAFRRYTGKTQVVYFASMLDEQLTSRSIHTLSVAQVARTIGRLLNLNLDLTEAIALGHDLGHPPFGHDGEKYLSQVSETYGLGQFHHNLQSLRVVDVISKRGEGLNLTFQVREGLLSHDGEVHDQVLEPEPQKNEKDLQAFIQAKEAGEDIQIRPMTLEGCVVRITDTIAYIGQDIEDAIRIGLINRSELPEESVKVLGNNNGQIIETLVRDVVENSYGKNYVCFSDTISSALKQLKNFNYKAIYKSNKLKVNHERIAKGFKILYEYFYQDITQGKNESAASRDFLASKTENYLKNNSAALQVRDFIAGMTDRYFVEMLKRTIVPEISLGDLSH
ncbi:MAG: HD domain-containing protein [Calditrichales bacterium]|nr:MAG: HD domain-containing protein [Calditrichales bacterium]